MQYTAECQEVFTRTGAAPVAGKSPVRYLLPVPHVETRGWEPEGLDDSLHGPVLHAGKKGYGHHSLPVRGRAGNLPVRSHPRPGPPPAPAERGAKTSRT